MFRSVRLHVVLCAIFISGIGQLGAIVDGPLGFEAFLEASANQANALQKQLLCVPMI